MLVEGDWECEHGQERAHWERHRATLRAEYQCTVTEDRHGEMERVASHLITQYPAQRVISIIPLLALLTADDWL